MESLSRYLAMDSDVWVWQVLTYLGVQLLFLDRCVALLRSDGPRRGLTDRLRSHLEQGDLAGALSLAASQRGASARIALTILKEALHPAERVEAARETALLREMPALESRIGWFGTLSSLATLLGLLGSITGLQGRAYSSVPMNDATSKATALAHQIGETLGSMATGLAVALLSVTGAMLAHGLIHRRVAALRAEAHAITNVAISNRAHLRLWGRRPFIEPTGYRRSA